MMAIMDLACGTGMEEMAGIIPNGLLLLMRSAEDPLINTRWL
jgi:hypothetical protein